MDYEELVAVVRELILDTGRLTTFTVAGAVLAGQGGPFGGATAADGTETLPATFVPASGADLGLKFIDTDLLKRCEQVCLVAPPESGADLGRCSYVNDGSVWRVEWVQTLRPGDTTLLYAVGVKR